MLWFALVVLAACTGALVALPFLRTRAQAVTPSTPIDIYRAQLVELARDQAAGEFDEAGASELRVEIERRILAAPVAALPRAAASAGFDRVTAIAVAAIVVVGAAVLYAATGQPNAPSAARAAPDAIAQAQQQSPEDQQAMINGMVEGLEQRLADHPRDAEGWVWLMRSRMVLGQPDRARAAYQRALAAFANDRATQQHLRAAATELAIPGAS